MNTDRSQSEKLINTCMYLIPVNNNCYNKNGNCSSLCIPNPTGYVCACADGIEMKDQYTCLHGNRTWSQEIQIKTNHKNRICVIVKIENLFFFIRFLVYVHVFNPFLFSTNICNYFTIYKSKFQFFFRKKPEILVIFKRIRWHRDFIIYSINIAILTSL